MNDEIIITETRKLASEIEKNTAALVALLDAVRDDTRLARKIGFSIRGPVPSLIVSFPVSGDSPPA